MLKTEQDVSEALQRYEIIFLIPNKYSEDEATPLAQSVSKLLKDNGGKIINEQNWGKRKLSYPIKHFYHAYYYIVECLLPKNKAGAIENNLRLDENILRHLIVQQREKTEAEIMREKQAAQRIAKEETARLAEEKTKTEIKAKQKEEKKSEVNMEELNEKLDKILDDTSNLL